jgi:hypothetical protein
MFATVYRFTQGHYPKSAGPGHRAAVGLIHANKSRTAKLGERLFWEAIEHLKHTLAQYAHGKLPKALLRFKRKIHIIDSTTIELRANCID